MNELATNEIQSHEGMEFLLSRTNIMKMLIRK